MSDDRCPMIATGTGEQCELPRGHNSPHEVTGDWGKMTWEPLYVGDMRRELEDGAYRWRALLRDVLEDVGSELRSDALDEARDALAAEAAEPAR